MTVEQREALRQARGTTSIRSFALLLADHGLGDAVLSRQRLSMVEKGHTDLTPELWHGVADALVASGLTEAEVARLRPAAVAVPVIEPVPPSTPDLRRRQWSSVANWIPASRWWLNLGALAEKLGGTDRIRQYRRLLSEYDIEPADELQEIRRRLEIGRMNTGPFGPQPGDAVRLGGDVDDRSVVLEKGTLFVLRATLWNTGTVPWRDRLLYRLGPPVTSSLPFALILLPVPDTDPGDSCEVLIPGRAQWFLNRAVISYVMVTADCTPCLPGRLDCVVDTRRPGEYDHTLSLPEGFRPDVARPEPGSAR